MLKANPGIKIKANPGIKITAVIYFFNWSVLRWIFFVLVWGLGGCLVVG